MAFSIAVYNWYRINKRKRKMQERYHRKEYDRIENLKGENNNDKRRSIEDINN